MGRRSVIARAAAISLAVALAAGPRPASAAASGDRFAFTRSVAHIDLDQPSYGAAFKRIVTAGGHASLVYLDWTFLNPTRSEVFSSGDAHPPERGRCPEAPAGRDTPVTYSGRPDPADDHLLVTFRIARQPGDGFLDMSCQQLGAGTAELRIRGFFHVLERRVPTAVEWELRPVRVEPALVPKGFFR